MDHWKAGVAFDAARGVELQPLRHGVGERRHDHGLERVVALLAQHARHRVDGTGVADLAGDGDSFSDEAQPGFFQMFRGVAFDLAF